MQWQVFFFSYITLICILAAQCGYHTLKIWPFRICMGQNLSWEASSCFIYSRDSLVLCCVQKSWLLAPILSQVNWVLCPPVSLGSINFAILHLYLYCEWIAPCISSCHKPVDICIHRKVNFSCLCLKYCVVNKKALTPCGSLWEHLGGMFWFGAWLYLLI